MKFKVDLEGNKVALGDLFGVFFEDLNHGADGGLYGELVQNRSFEFSQVDHPSYNALTAWEKVEGDGEVRLIVETGNPVSDRNPHYLGMDIMKAGEDVGVRNLGWGKGIPLVRGEKYLFRCFVKREQCRCEPVRVSLRSGNGEILAEQEFCVSDKWQEMNAELVSTADDCCGKLYITAAGTGKVYLDFVSLFARNTFLGRRNGLRKDIAELLQEMEPKFMRFPGGCLVHDGSLDPDARDASYRWKNTVGPVENRPARRNNWGYNQTLGLGFYELFEFCEDIGAKPLPVIGAGYDPHHKREVPLEEMGPWVDDALDLIEFANGGADTRWGSIRAQMGHPEPFGMEYLGIGNEEVGEGFFERFQVIFRAVREKNPEIRIIGTSGPFAEGGEFDRGWESARRNGADLVDEHYYMSPEWFLAHHHRYDSYPKEGPKVFLGEYASWGNTWYHALTEASFMIGLERNAQAVGLACYAPMLANVDYVNWKPDMIWFDHYRAFGTPNYYVQKMFMKHQGKYQLKVEAMEPVQAAVLSLSDKISGALELSGYEADIVYSDISLVNDDTGEEILLSGCRVSREKEERVRVGVMDCSSYTLRLKALEEDGYRGFRIYFGSENEENEFCWTLGGWQNQDTLIGEKINGRNSDLCQHLLEIEKGRVYDLRLEVRGRHIATYVDNVLYHQVDSLPVVVEPLYLSAQESEDGELIWKAVNVSGQPCEAEIALSGESAYPVQEVEIICMEGFPLNGCNSFEQPELISPVKKVAAMDPSNFRLTVPGQSISMFRWKK